MSLVEISEHPPGSDDNGKLDSRVWFQVLESMRRLELAIRAVREDVDAEVPIRLYPLILYGRGADQNAATSTGEATYASVAWNLGPFSGLAQGHTNSFPSSYMGAQQLQRSGEPRNDFVSLFQCGTSSSVTTGDAARFVWTMVIPPGFNRWKTEAIVVYYGLGFTGVTTSGKANVHLRGTSPVPGVGNVEVTSGDHDESSGSISVSYGARMVMTADDLKDLDCVEGSSLQLVLAVELTSVTDITAGAFRIGRVEFNWE